MSVELINYNDLNAFPDSQPVSVPYCYRPPEVDTGEYEVPYEQVTWNQGTMVVRVPATGVTSLRIRAHLIAAVMAATSTTLTVSATAESKKPKDGWYRQHGKRWER